MTFHRLIKRLLMLSLTTTAVLMMAIAMTLAAKAHAMTTQAYVSSGQSPLDWAINALSERLTHLESLNLDSRVSVLEHGMDEIRYWTRGIAMTVLAQLIYLIWPRIRQDGHL